MANKIRTSKLVAKKASRQLKCKQDTWAMVAILDALRNRAK